MGPGEGPVAGRCRPRTVPSVVAAERGDSSQKGPDPFRGGSTLIASSNPDHFPQAHLFIPLHCRRVSAYALGGTRSVCSQQCPPFSQSCPVPAALRAGPARSCHSVFTLWLSHGAVAPPFLCHGRCLSSVLFSVAISGCSSSYPQSPAVGQPLQTLLLNKGTVAGQRVLVAVTLVVVNA